MRAVFAGQRAYRRVYLFEVVAIVHVAVVWLVLWSDGFEAIGNFGSEFVQTGYPLLFDALLGVLIRAGVEAFRGKGRAYFRAVLSVGWITDTLRLAFAGVFTVLAYSRIKLMVPVYHSRLFDSQLWSIDTAICGGYSPNIFLLNLFSTPRALLFFDLAYARIFFVSLMVATIFFLSHPNRRVRVAFITGHTFLWLSGAWLYLGVPSLGPAYAFPDAWMQRANYFPITRMFQAMLMSNYQRVLQVRQGLNLPVSWMYGIAAFPSLHVGFQAFMFLWMRRVWVYGQLVFGIFLLFVFLGSMITGWHYMVDGLAGLVMAGLCYYVFGRRYRIFRWLHLQRLLAAR